MEILLTYVTTNPRGQPQRDQRRVSGPVVAIGRGTQCQIQLPDPRVAIAHARITVTEQGDTSIQADSGSLEINDQNLQGAPLRVGDRISIGPYSFQVDPPPTGIPLALTITLTSPLAALLTDSEAKSAALAAAKLPHSKRRLAYLLFFGVLLLCLLVPVAADIFSYFGGAAKPGFGGVQAVSTKFTRLWNPGTLSRSHQIFGSDCRACHQLPFVQVRDAACLECHRSIKEHINPARLTGPHGGAMQETRCAECHRDHKDTALATRSQQQCVDCHRDVKRFAAGANSENVTDFRADHPPFRLSLLGADTPGQKHRIRQGTPEAATAVEHSNLKFNHKLHLDPRGIRDPGGKSGESSDISTISAMSEKKKRNPLVCADCHVADQAGMQMQPISMEQHCQRCHSLAFEPKVTPRQVPHGSEQAVATMLREFYARLALGDAPPDVNIAALDMPRVRPGAVLTYEDRQRVLQIAEAKAQLALTELFVTREVCATCHTVSQTESPGSEDAGWKVKPVRLAEQWMPQASFSHEKHLTQKCTICHDVSGSTKAEQIALPDIKKCRECHVGAQPVAGKVTSDCASCHQFHFGADAWHGMSSVPVPASKVVSPHAAFNTPAQQKDVK